MDTVYEYICKLAVVTIISISFSLLIRVRFSVGLPVSMIVSPGQKAYNKREFSHKYL